MAKTVISVVKEKYMDTDIDVIIFHFNSTKKESFVSEFPVPENCEYMINYSSSEGNIIPNWIEIINPKAVLEYENPVLPDIGSLLYKGTDVDLKTLIGIILV